jgi:hypothetical protein
MCKLWHSFILSYMLILIEIDYISKGYQNDDLSISKRN